MFGAPSSLHAIDIHTLVFDMAKSIEPYIVGRPSKEKQSMLYVKMSSIARDIIDDLITENLYWTTDTTVATPERYLEKLNYIKDMAPEALDLFDHYIVDLEDLLYTRNLLPSWSFFEVISKLSYIIIHCHGDYRIEDWMAKNGKKIKKTRFCSDRGRR